MNIFKQILSKSLPSDVFSKKYPISVKGIVCINGKTVLLKNEREEWELPGGKLELEKLPSNARLEKLKKN